MFRDTFLPVRVKDVKSGTIDWHTQSSFPDLGNARLIVFGVIDELTDYTDYPVCNAINHLVWDGLQDEIIHLGLYMKTCSDEGLQKLVEFLLKNYPDAGLFIYGLGGEGDALTGLADKDDITLITPHLKKDEVSVANKLLKDSRFERLVIGGLQNYLVDPVYRKLSAYPQIEVFRLSEMEPENIEVAVRHAKFVFADYRVLAKGVVQSEYLPYVAGMDIDRWVSVFYFSGLSPVNRMIALLNISVSEIINEDAQVIALGLWHYFEGIKNKTVDFPLIPLKKLEKRTVLINDVSTNIYRNPRTGRQWVEVYSFEKKRLIPVTEQMVFDAINEKGLDRLLKYLQS